MRVLPSPCGFVGLDTCVIDYPVLVPHPVSIAHVRAEILREREMRECVGVIVFSAGGHLAGLACLSGADGESADFGVLFYPVSTMAENGHAGRSFS